MDELNGDEIVISGISGMFPGAGNVYQFSEKLYNKIDMVSRTNKYPHIKHPEFPQYLGEADGIEHFDSQFFRVTSKQAKYMDPVMGKILENTFSALLDAGMNPDTVSPSLGVYIACSQIDSVNYMFSDIKASSFVISGGSKCMLANRVSYWMDGKGPSYNLDSGNTGSMKALEIAYNAMKKGEIECAMVGGCNYCFKPELTLNMKRAGLLCLDGKTKCFDKNGDGYVRSDAINVFFLQKAKDAKRIYAEVCLVKGKYFASPDGLFTPKRNPTDIELFLKEFYTEAKISPNDVEYLEANGLGIAEADGNELEAVGNVFAKDKTIKIGSVKSNIGNTECTSGASSIIKLCLAYQSGQIPANLHFSEPQTHIKAVKEEKLQVVNDNLPFNRKFTAINNFCYTGNNFHTLLKGHFKPKDKERYESSLPRLVLVASREEEGVNNMLNILESNPIDPEQLALLNNFFKHNLTGFTCRGYAILVSDENHKTVALARSFEYFSGKTRPICFLYSGMGSQWAGMGEGLLKIPVFAAAIERCSNILKKKGLDLIDIITNKDSKQLNILKSLMAITAIQIGLTDVLKSIGIFPDHILGHSVGEIASAYGDGSLTTKETILTSYARAIATYETKFIKGTMAAVGIGYKEVIRLCPPEIEVACHNSSESATIAGPSEAVSVFVKSLTDRRIFAKEVDSYNIAFHSRYINEAGPKMLKLLREVIKNPKPRSNKWLSTCYLPEDWKKPECQYASAEYFAHNLMHSVLLEEAANYIPEDAIIIELAPHGLLQAIMKRSHSECINIPLTKRGETDSAKFLLNALGKLYQTGLNIDLESLYPKVEYPVSTETPLLSHFVKWGDQKHWQCNAGVTKNETPIIKEFVFSLHDDEFNFLKRNKRDGIYIIPEAALLVFAWKTLAAFEKKILKKSSVVFDNVTFYEQISVEIDEIARFVITIQKCSSKFEVFYKDKLVAEGKIYLIEKSNKQFDKITFGENERHLTQSDIYSLLRIRGYNYGGEFQSLMTMNFKMNKTEIKWNEEWITFLDSIFQIKILSDNHESLSRVKYLNNLTIDTYKHNIAAITSNGAECYNALLNNETGAIICGGVVAKDIVLDKFSKPEIASYTQKELKADKTNNNKTKNSPINGLNGLKSYKLVAKEDNNLESLTWIESPVIRNTTTVQVYYSGLSSKDCKKLSGPDNQSFGMDFSGLDHKGGRVMGLVPNGAIASTVEADLDLLWPVPQHWSLADAATVPLPYVHAFYCLAIRHKMSKKDIILVTGAAGALGQAVISIAIHAKCTIFATVGNACKKRFLLKLFPELDENNIGYTYDVTFRAMVAEKTKNKRCNIVVNTYLGQLREEAMMCVGDEIFNSAFLDVNDTDQKENKIFRMGFLDGDKSYKSVNMATIFDPVFKIYKKELFRLISEGISKGYVRPLTSVIYSPLEISEAFKLLSRRCNIGRALVNMKDYESNMHDLDSVQRITLYPSRSYIVVCDGSELGVELINLLIQRGAKKILVHCHPSTINGYFLARHIKWKKCGISLEFNCDDLRLENNCQNIVNNAKKNANVDGIFITWSNFHMNHKNIDRNLQDMKLIVSNMDKKARFCKDLRYFAVLTAVSQNLEICHELKNLEEFCHRRKELELPSLYIQNILQSKVWHSKSLLIVFNELEKSLLSNVTTVTTYLEDFDAKMENENHNTNFNAGLNAFYQNILLNELEAAEPVVHLKTKVSENELMCNPENEYIIMIPGFDGNAKSLTFVAERLNKPAIALQMDVDQIGSISDIAKTMLNHIKMRCHLKSPFTIMGYSFGANIALEIAAILEQEGFIGIVYCLDSSPDALRAHLDAYLGDLQEEQLQNLLIEHIYKHCSGQTSNQLSNNLSKAETWTEKLELFIATAQKAKVPYSHNYLRNLLETANNRIQLAKMYKPKFVLNSKIVLLKGIAHPNVRNLNNCYNLSLYTNKPVQVFDIKSDHAMAVNDCRVSNYINRTLKH